MHTDRNTKCSSCPLSHLSFILSTGVRSVRIDVGKEEVLVEASLTSHEVQGLIGSTGRRAALKGIGGTEQDLGTAVAMIVGSGTVQGVVRFLQLSEERDLTQDCQSCGEHYNPYGRQHGASQDPDRHVGDLGNIVAGPDGRASFRQKDPQLKVWDVIGHSLVVDAGEDDLGRSGHPPLQTDRELQNAKQICACDVVTLWEERGWPGTGRSKTTTETPAAHL
uniref:Copper chaperone for superoxide dismutase n=1 Tax=Oncorhynchus kisutch TaxID=8019 RepID=A0A8C7DQ12_ONCKI